jgi:predicted dehydrogenase
MKIAVVGAGAIGRVHMKVVQAYASANPNPNVHAKCELSAVVDPSEAAKTLTQSLNIPYFSNLENLLSHAKPDGIILATPNAMHVTQALQCLEAGVAVLVEKPIAHTVADAQRLVAATDAKGDSNKARVLVGHHRAHSPIMAKATAVIEQGRLGRLVSVMGSAMFFKPDNYFADAPWRTLEGGGPILINLIHEIHNLRMLCGNIVEIQAMSSNAVRGFQVEDTVAINFRFDSGVLGTFLLSDTSASARSWEQTSQENKDYAAYDDEDCYVIAGTMGSLSIPTMRLKTYPTQGDRSWFKPFDTDTLELNREDPLKLQLAHFLDVIQGQASPLVSVKDGLQNLQVVEGIASAIKTQQTVRLVAD